MERQRTETDGIRANNEAVRSATAITAKEADSQIAIDEKRASSEIQLAENRAEIEDEAIEVDTEMSRKERIFFMWMIALGLLTTVVSSVVAGLTMQPLFATGGGIGLLVTGGGLRRLSVLTSPRRRKECLLRRKAPEKQDPEAAGTS